MFTYTRLGFIGSGGFGNVFAAIQKETGVMVAIKFLNDRTYDALERFRREARILFRMANPHILGIVDHNFKVSEPFIVLEYCDGGSLSDWVSRRQPLINIVATLASISHAVADLHSFGGFHRDIKPANILLKRTSSNAIIPKLADFGLARSEVTVSDSVTRNPLGTLGYMAPELRDGFPYDSRCDVYSLGITGIEILTGQRNRMALLRADIPSDLRNILWSMTSPDPSFRPSASSVTGAFVRVHESIRNAHSRDGDFFKGLLKVGLVLAGVFAVTEIFES